MMNWKETKCGKCKIQRSRPVCNSCFSYDKFIPIAITNADRIRSMSDEELAELLYSIQNLEDKVKFCKNKIECDNILDIGKEIPDNMCKQCLVDWLQSEMEEQHEKRIIDIRQIM